jgi:hypothetical protein
MSGQTVLTISILNLMHKYHTNFCSSFCCSCFGSVPFSRIEGFLAESDIEARSLALIFFFER